MKRAMIILIVLVLASLACALPGLGSSSPKVIFSDDFSNENSGWPTINEADGTANYKDGGYELTVPDPDSGYWASPELEDQTNTTIEVDATVTGSARDSDFGILCRGIDSDNQVLLLISADGYAAIGKFTGGEFVLLSGEEWVEIFRHQPGDHAQPHSRRLCGQHLRLVRQWAIGRLRHG